jgi:hypothetical protein
MFLDAKHERFHVAPADEERLTDAWPVPRLPTGAAHSLVAQTFNHFPRAVASGLPTQISFSPVRMTNAPGTAATP